MICPSAGFGNWDREGDGEAIGAVVKHAVERFAIDPRRVVLAALSNGGRRLTRALSRRPGICRGAILISAVLEDAPISAAASVGAPVLVFHGEHDARVPIEYTRRRLARLTGAGAQVEGVVDRDEDHFLFLSRRDAILRRVAEWVDDLE